MNQTAFQEPMFNNFEVRSARLAKLKSTAEPHCSCCGTVRDRGGICGTCYYRHSKKVARFKCAGCGGAKASREARFCAACRQHENHKKATERSARYSCPECGTNRKNGGRCKDCSLQKHKNARLIGKACCHICGLACKPGAQCQHCESLPGDPTPAQITELCRDIRESWDSGTLQQRQVHKLTRLSFEPVCGSLIFGGDYEIEIT